MPRRWRVATLTSKPNKSQGVAGQDSHHQNKHTYCSRLRRCLRAGSSIKVKQWAAFVLSLVANNQVHVPNGPGCFDCVSLKKAYPLMPWSEFCHAWKELLETLVPSSLILACPHTNRKPLGSVIEWGTLDAPLCPANQWPQLARIVDTVVGIICFVVSSCSRVVALLRV